MIATRLSQLRNDQDLLSAAHFEFQKGRRCQGRALVLAETIKYMARRGCNTFATFIEVKKAHPTVLRTAMMARLHTKLSETGSGAGNKCSRAWAFIDKMYKHCSSRIVIDGHESDDYVVKHGLRGGSALSPILFTNFHRRNSERYRRRMCWRHDRFYSR